MGKNFQSPRNSEFSTSQAQYSSNVRRRGDYSEVSPITIILVICVIVLTIALVTNTSRSNSKSSSNYANSSSTYDYSNQLNQSSQSTQSYSGTESSPSQKPVSDYLSGFSSKVTAPRSESILSPYLTKYVITEHGNYTDLYSDASSNNKIDNLAEGAEVTVLAVQGGRSLVSVNNSSVGGWVNSKFLYDSYYSGPNPTDTKNLPEGVLRPGKDDYISTYENMYVRSSRGVRIYLLDKPDLKPETDPAEVIGYIYEAERVTVLARKSGYSFVECGDGRGWCNSSLLVYTY